MYKRLATATILALTILLLVVIPVMAAYILMVEEDWENDTLPDWWWSNTNWEISADGHDGNCVKETINSTVTFLSTDITCARAGRMCQWINISTGSGYRDYLRFHYDGTLYGYRIHLNNSGISWRISHPVMGDQAVSGGYWDIETTGGVWYQWQLDWWVNELDQVVVELWRGDPLVSLGTRTDEEYNTFIDNNILYCGYRIANQGRFDETQIWLGNPQAPPDLLATPLSSSEIYLSWTPGAGGTTAIYYKTGGYPADREDGTKVYFGTAEAVTHRNLSPGTTYFYRAWDYNPEDETYSPNYDEDYATTFMGAEGPEGPPMPPEWFQTPSCTAYEKLPFFFAIEDTATAYSFPLNNFCLLLTLLWIAGAGLGSYLMTKTNVIAIAVVIVAIAISSIAGLLPMWMLLIDIVLAGGMIFIWQRA